MPMSIIATPEDIVKDMFALLPKDFWHPNIKILDITCKRAEFLLEARSILMQEPSMIKLFSHEWVREFVTLNHNLYGIGLLKKTRELTSDALSSLCKTNIIDVYDYEIKVKSLEGQEEIKKLIQGAFGDMKFDLVVGNPPYNNDLYLDFVNLAYKLTSRYVLMITPAKWQAKTDAKPKTKDNKQFDKNEAFRNNIVPHMSKVVFYRDTHDVFDIDDNAGLSYYLIDKQKHGHTMVKNICTKNNRLSSEFEPHDEIGLNLYNHRIQGIIGKVGTLGGDLHSRYMLKIQTMAKRA